MKLWRGGKVETKKNVKIVVKEAKDLKNVFNYLTFIELGDFVLFDDYELYNTKTRETKSLGSYEKAYQYIIESDELKAELMDFSLTLVYDENDER